MEGNEGKVVLRAEAANRDPLTSTSTCLIDVNDHVNRAALESAGFKLEEPAEESDDQTDMGGPAFPHGNPEQGGHPGEVTLWDWHARGALEGLISQTPGEFEVRQIVNDARHIADAMLEERARRMRGEK